VATTLLYHRDPLLLSFSARVAAHRSFAGKPSLVLEKTALYPEAGGQMADRGTLGRARVARIAAG
jgi:alanyl-tRNA synthetase